MNKFFRSTSGKYYVPIVTFAALHFSYMSKPKHFEKVVTAIRPRSTLDLDLANPCFTLSPSVNRVDFIKSVCLHWGSIRG